MKKLLCFVSVAFFSMSASANIFYLNQTSDTYNFSNPKGSYVLIVNHSCNNKPGGEVCITRPEDGSCNTICNVNQPCELKFPANQGKTIALHVAAKNKLGRACGDVEVGP